MKKIIIIGAGVIGSLIARELSRFNLEILILEKEVDISMGASKANSGIIHGGYDAKNGKKKAYFARRGNEKYDELEKELNFGFKRCGSLVLGFNEKDLKKLRELEKNAIQNGVKVEIIGKEKIKELEPKLNEKAIYALYCKNAGIASPYELTIAGVENAIQNGVEIKLNEEVKKIERIKNKYYVTTTNKYEADIVINASGINSDKISSLAGIKEFNIIPRKGEYLVFQKNYDLVKHVIFQCPTEKGKGILVTPTIHNNLMIGPNALEENKLNKEISFERIKKIFKTAKKSVPELQKNKAIRAFAGFRATSNTRDFIISNHNGFINVGGIDSPGLTSSPAIADHVVELVSENIKLSKKKNFNPYRKSLLTVKGEEVICRCERVTKETIENCFIRKIPITSVDAIKRRVRAGMGFCQGNYCEVKIKKIIADKTGLELKSIKGRNDSESKKILKMLKEVGEDEI